MNKLKIRLKEMGYKLAVTLAVVVWIFTGCASKDPVITTQEVYIPTKVTISKELWEQIMQAPDISDNEAKSVINIQEKYLLLRKVFKQLDIKGE